MNIDLRTLILVLSVIYLLQAFVLFLQYLYNKKYMGLGWWAGGLALLAAGFTCTLLRDIRPIALLSIFANNIFLLCGTLFLYVGFMRFIGKREPQRLIYFFLALFVVTAFYFTFIHDNMATRIAVFSLAAAALLILLAYNLWHYRAFSITVFSRALALVLLVTAIFNVTRAMVAILLPPTNHFFAATPFQISIFFGALIFNLVWTFLLTNMVNYRLIFETRAVKNALEKEKELFKTTLFSIADGVIVADADEKILLFNQAAAKISHWSKEDAKNRPVREIFNIMDEFEESPSNWPDLATFPSNNLSEMENALLLTKDGQKRYIEYSIAPIASEVGSLYGIVLIFRDLSARKARQEKIEFLSYHDQLTGLYNRRYYVEALQRLDVAENLPFTVIMGDVNGLKLCNDAFGHAAGDKLLQTSAEIMHSVCRSHDIIARIGGDEFVILLTNTDPAEAEAMVERINQQIAGVHLDPIILSVSFGWACKQKLGESIADVLKRAEDDMYKRKLSESIQVRKLTLQLILKTLQTRSAFLRNHLHNVGELCASFGEALEFDHEEIDYLRRLGYMHDIGKIAIDNKLLYKNEPLSRQERLEIQRHAETGYRILNSVSEFVPMSEYVLAHHEQWDGSGYPQGLKGESIPLYARILAIADAFESMTSNRPYRAAISPEAAMAEIKKFAGRQFDPQLVKIFEEKVYRNGSNHMLA